MNIIVRPYGSDQCYCRPDTTWERENRDLYSPECVNEWNAAPILFARISKAGKCISSKFVSRYYDGFSFGILLYTGGRELPFASCADHTSILPFPLYNPVVLENEDNIFTLARNGTEIFNSEYRDKTSAISSYREESGNLKSLLEESICKASELTSLRIGDFVAVELSPLAMITSRHEEETTLKGTFCDNILFDFKVIY